MQCVAEKHTDNTEFIETVVRADKTLGKIRDWADSGEKGYFGMERC